MTARTPEAEPLLTPAEVATMFRVDPKTVTRWAKAGKLTSIRTLGGHRRYREAEVRALLAGIPAQRDRGLTRRIPGDAERRHGVTPEPVRPRPGNAVPRGHPASRAALRYQEAQAPCAPASPTPGTPCRSAGRTG